MTAKGCDGIKQSRNAGAWGVLTAGVLIQLLTGFPTAWGSFRQPVMETYDLDGGAAAFAANCIVGAYGAGCVAGGFLQDRFGSRAAGVSGSLLLTLGLTGAGFAPANRPVLFYWMFSVPVGLGCAFLYPAVMDCVQKWFFGHKGLATGLVGAGVGFSGLVLSWFVGISSRHWGMRRGFWLLAALTGPVCLIASLLLKNPPQQKEKSELEGMKPKQMLKTKQYRLAFCSMMLATPALLLFAPSILQLAQQRGMSAKWTGWLIPVSSLSSAAGRLSMAAAADQWGKRNTDLLLFAALAGLSVGLAFAQSGWLMPVYILLCFCYAGQMSIMPSLCTQLFGTAHTGINYGFLALGASLGSIGFPLAARYLQLEAGRHWLAAFAALAGFLCIWRLQVPQNEKKKEAAP